jgi:hypothetical protein
MAFAAAETLAQVLRDFGPPILKTSFVHGKTSESRLQLAGDDLHSGAHDPHREGRAVDIVLVAWEPSQRAEAEELIRVFRQLVGTIQWGGLIYSRKEWSPRGEQPRLFRSKEKGESSADYAVKKARHEHTSHIHIEWEDHKKQLNDFRDALISALKADLDMIAELEALPHTLHGSWDVAIGDWSGVFKFTRSGSVTWHNNPGAAPGGTGQWNADTAGKLRWRFGGGDIRTFVTALPIDRTQTPGDILPQGQGWFSMSKRP